LSITATQPGLSRMICTRSFLFSIILSFIP